MQQLFNGNIDIYYGQFYIDDIDAEADSDSLDSDVVDDDSLLDVDSAFAQQLNGLCGACHLGKLFFIAEPQEGVAHVAVELHTEEPPLLEHSDDVVECSFAARSNSLHLCEWANEATYPLSLPLGDYICRYSICATDSEYKGDETWRQPLAGQHFIIQFWPGKLAQDRIVVANSQKGHYWHKTLGVTPEH
ncbi:MAG: hypothetical protein HWE13_12440 [Gammaproteobacteria bacterium]|nr:hypothetical protein [Gammaproteobacteria bacterium]